jgi:hypothetical protein
VWILGFVSLSHEFLVFGCKTDIMLLLGCFCFGFCWDCILGHVEMRLCILDPLPPFGTIEKKEAYVSNVIL